MALRKAMIFTALSAALALAAGDALARPGGGGSSGSRGARTYSQPSATPTAPKSAAPIERSITPQQSVNPGASGIGAASKPAGGFFSGGFGRGLLGGLIGAGLIGMLFGNGLMGGLGGMMSFLGLLLQIGLIFLLVRFAIGFFRSRQQPQAAGAGPQTSSFGGLGGGRPNGGGVNGGLQGGAYAAPGAGFGGGAAPAMAPLTIGKPDYDMFEQRLHEIEDAFSAENVGALRGFLTPEMASYLEQEIADNAARGQVNRISGVKLLKGDLSESWREPDAEYATVAMRFSLVDTMLDRRTGAVVPGSSTIPSEVTELWTFRRNPGADASGWRLSAIQQAQ